MAKIVDDIIRCDGYEKLTEGQLKQTINLAGEHTVYASIAKDLLATRVELAEAEHAAYIRALDDVLEKTRSFGWLANWIENIINQLKANYKKEMENGKTD